MKEISDKTVNFSIQMNTLKSTSDKTLTCGNGCTILNGLTIAFNYNVVNRTNSLE